MLKILIAILIFWSENAVLVIQKIRLPSRKFYPQLRIEDWCKLLVNYWSVLLVWLVNYYRKCLLLSRKIMNTKDDFVYGFFQTTHGPLFWSCNGLQAKLANLHLSSNLFGCPIRSALCHTEAKSFENYFYFSKQSMGPSFGHVMVCKLN